MERWQNAVALITGASAGIGWSVARALHKNGMRVVLAARRTERLEELATHLGDRVLAVPTDMRDVAAIESLFATVRRKWGGVDVLVNNAGLGRDAPLMSGDTEQWREMLEVNVLALCVCTREAVADMRRADKGHVVHLASMASHRVPSGSGVYSATKFAVRSLTEGLRMELRDGGSNIRVSAISPGYVETEFAEHYHQSKSAAEKTYGQYKVLEADDVANAVTYVLAQPDHVQVHDVLMRPTAQRG